MKKQLISIAAMAIIAASMPISHAAAYTAGDANLDGQVDSKDAVLILQYYANELSGYNANHMEQNNVNFSCYDINSDGNIDSKDAVKVLQAYAQKLAENPPVSTPKPKPAQTEVTKSNHNHYYVSTPKPKPAQTEVTKSNHNHYYGELADGPDGCSGWYYYSIENFGGGKYIGFMGDKNADQYVVDHGFVPNEGDRACGWVWLG